MDEKQTRFVESGDSDIKKLVANAVPESTKSQQNMLSTSLKVKKVRSRLSDLVHAITVKLYNQMYLFTSFARIHHQINTGFLTSSFYAI